MTKTSNQEPSKFAVLASDTVVLTLRDNKLYVRLISVNRPPFFNKIPGLPGGLLDPNEQAEEAAERHVEEKAKISGKKLYTEQLYTFSKIDRDPRGRVVAVAYLSLIPWEKLSKEEQEDSKETWWQSIKKAKKLAYDHDEILTLALKRLQSRISHTTIISRLMPKEFTLTELEETYETILKTDLDKRNFRKKILKLGIVKPLASKRRVGKSRPAQLYHFSSSKVEEIEVI